MTEPIGPVSALPARASLEHLKKTAKRLHREMLRENAAAPLSAAQTEIARRYGFANWRLLKAYVLALATHGPDLVLAVQNGDAEKVSALLATHPGLVNAPVDLDPHVLRPSDARAMRLLHLAVAADQREILKLLIERGANMNARNADGRKPLHDCFELGRDDLAQILLGAGAEPDVCLAAAWGMHAQLTELLKHDPDQANDLETGMSPLGWCAYGGDQSSSAEILFGHGAVVDRAPFDWAAWGPATHVANTAVARVFLAHGADPNARSQVGGDTPLHRVITSRLVEDPSDFVAMLLSAGADPSIANDAGQTPLDEALAQQVAKVETYFPARPVRGKQVERTIALLRSATALH